MSSTFATSALPAPKRIAAMLLAVGESVVDNWTRAIAARRLAETYLTLSDDALRARGVTREDVIERIRRILTDIS